MGAFLVGKVSLLRAVLYIVFQCLGSLLAAAALKGVSCQTSNASKTAAQSRHSCCYLSPPRCDASCWLQLDPYGYTAAGGVVNALNPATGISPAAAWGAETILTCAPLLLAMLEKRVDVQSFYEW